MSHPQQELINALKKHPKAVPEMLRLLSELDGLSLPYAPTLYLGQWKAVFYRAGVCEHRYDPFCRDPEDRCIKCGAKPEPVEAP